MLFTYFVTVTQHLYSMCGLVSLCVIIILFCRVTNEDGRCPSLLMGVEIGSGCYKMKFDTKSYFTANGIKGFYPYVEVSKLLNIPWHKYVVFVSGVYLCVMYTSVWSLVWSLWCVLVCDVYSG